MKKTLLLTIDFINDIVHPEGRIPRCAPMVAEQKVIANTNAALVWAREQHFTVAHVKVGFPPGYANCPSHSPLFGAAAAHEALLLDSWGTAFHSELQVVPGDFIVTKPRVSIFYNTNLDSLLRAQRIESVILTGVSTDMAIESAVREAHDRDYQVYVLSDCCAATTPVAHTQTLSGAVSHLSSVLTLAQLKEQYRR